MYPGYPLTTTDRTEKPRHFRPPTQSARQSIPILKTSHSRHAHKNPVNFDSPRKDQVNFDPYTKTKSISTLHKNQVNFDLNTEIMSILIPTLKPNQFRCPDTQKIELDTKTNCREWPTVALLLPRCYLVEPI